eukprot:m.575462 g.575462  ORF g.575462 m.575462 type:complete len:55 (+) comp22284_c1_seq47:951-1115(+)
MLWGRIDPRNFELASGWTTSIMLCTSLTNWSTSGANDGNDTAYSFGQHIGGQAQ